jgi:hypothetical protein
MLFTIRIHDDAPPFPFVVTVIETRRDPES